MAASRKLIRTGQITLTVDSYAQAADQVKGIAEANGGYLADARRSAGAADRQHGSLTIRVEAAAFRRRAGGAARRWGTSARSPSPPRTSARPTPTSRRACA